MLQVSDIAADQARRRRGLLLLGLAVGFLGAAMALQQGVNENYLVDEIGVQGQQRGGLEALRETAGLTGFVFLALLAGLAEPVVGSLMLMVFAVGIGGYWLAPSYGWVLMMSVIWSQGLHVWMPLPSSMALGLAEPGQAGRRLGQLTSASALGAGLGLLAGIGLMQLHLSVRVIYLLAACLGLLAAACCWGIPRGLKTPGPRLVFRRRYWLYYLLCFMDGCRKQIFLCFAGFLLVRQHHVSVQKMLLLWLVVNAIGYFFNPLAGRLIDRLGERRILTFYFGSLTTVFVGYAFLSDIRLLYGLFVLDSVFFVFNNAITVYADRLTGPGERTATLSMGVAANHLAAVSMPLAGGWLWNHLGFQWCFLAGAAAAVVSVPVALRLPKRTPRPARTVTLDTAQKQRFKP